MDGPLVAEMQVGKLQLKYREGRFWLQGDLAFFNSARKHLAIAHHILYIWQYGLSNFQGRDRKLDKFLAKLKNF